MRSTQLMGLAVGPMGTLISKGGIGTIKMFQ